MHKPLYKLLILGWATSCGSANTVRPQQPTDSGVAVVSPIMIPDSTVAWQPKAPTGIPFDSVKKKYPTLIPIFDGLFITYAEFDYAQYRKLIGLPDMDSLVWHGKKMDSRSLLNGLICNAKTDLKWGVIDSAGNTILPFACDAVRAIDAGKGIFSVCRMAYDLNTGISRFRYEGDYFFFDKKGIKNTIGTPFEITVMFASDYCRDAPPVQQGPAFYLPSAYQKKGRMARGAV